MKIDEPRSFDLSAIAHLPEFHALQQAVQDLAHQLDRMPNPPLTRPQFVEAVTDVARVAYAADVCDRRCEQSDSDMEWPHKAVVEGDGMTGTYRCSHCGAIWTCAYTTNLAWLPA